MIPFLKQSQVVFPEGPLPDTVLTVAGIPAGTCAGLPEARCDEILRLARDGLDRLRRMRDWSPRPPTAGMESEVHVVQRGRPSHLPARLCAETEARARGIVPESGRHVLEMNSGVRERRGGFLRELDAELRAQIAFIREHPLTREGKAALCPAGVLPSFLADDMTLGSVTPNPRYTQLHQTITHLSERQERYLHVQARGSGGITEITLSNTHLRITAPSVRFTLACGDDDLLPFALKAAMASMQFHWSVPDIDDYVAAHRLADLLAAPMVAIAANSPFFGGYATGLKATRLALWPAGSHPRRVGLGDSWIAEPLEQFEEILRDDPVYRPLLDPENAGKESHRVLSPLDALIEHSKTFWRCNRTTISTDGERAALRIEHRPICIAPTVTDEIATAALFYGLMAGFPTWLRDRHGLTLAGTVEAVEERLPYRLVTENMDNATAWGLDALLTWVDGREYRARELFEAELLPIAREGLRSLDIPEDDIARYVGVLSRRLVYTLPGRAAGTIPADVQLYLNEAVERRATARGLSLNVEERTVALVRLLCAVFDNDLRAGPCDIVEWLARYVGAGEAHGVLSVDPLDDALRATDG